MKQQRFIAFLLAFVMAMASSSSPVFATSAELGSYYPAHETAEEDNVAYTNYMNAMATTPPGITPRFGITVIFDPNGGQTMLGHASRTTAAGSAASGTIGYANMPANPSRAGFWFSHWNTMPDGSGTRFTGSTTVLAANAPVTVYAI